MKRHTVSAVGLSVFLLSLLSAVPARAQIYDCGTVTLTHALWQYMKTRGVEMVASTYRDYNDCPLKVRVEAWVEGVSGTLRTNESAYSAVVDLITPVPAWGPYTSYSKHFLIQMIAPFYWIEYPKQRGDVTITPPDPGTIRRTDEETCIMTGGYWDGYRCIPQNCPLILDLDRPGYRLTSPEDGVWFDIDADGAPERVAWTQAGSSAAFLAFDRNGNGAIDNGSELFGNRSPAYPGEAGPTAQNGFEALKMLETPGGYGATRNDGVIDARDAAFGRLLLWCDRNHNGISEPNELTPVSAAGLLSLETDYRSSERHDKSGNVFRQHALSWWEKNGARVPVEYYDVWLMVQR